MSSLSSSVPVILVCTAALSTNVTSFSHGMTSPPKLASFQPHSQLSLRTGLLHSPQTISVLRVEAADRFMRWREAERCLEGGFHLIRNEKSESYFSANQRRSTITRYSADAEEIEKWNKATWEAMLSEDVARRLRQTRSSEKSTCYSDSSLAGSRPFTETSCFSPSLDPLHLRSLMLLSVSLFAPRSALSLRSSRSRSKNMNIDETRSTVRPRRSNSRARSRTTISDRWHIWRWGIALFCAGVGIGCVLSAMA